MVLVSVLQVVLEQQDFPESLYVQKGSYAHDFDNCTLALNGAGRMRLIRMLERNMFICTET